MDTQLHNTIQNPTIEVTVTATQEIGGGLREVQAFVKRNWTVNINQIIDCGLTEFSFHFYTRCVYINFRLNIR
jgi:hypothetical protein